MKRFLLILVTVAVGCGVPPKVVDTSRAPSGAAEQAVGGNTLSTAVPAFKPLPLVEWGPPPPGRHHDERVRIYDLQHQVVHVRFDWGRHAVVGSTTLKLAALDAPLDTVALDAVDMTIQAVEGTAGKALPYDYDGRTLAIRLPAPLPAGQATEIRVAYETVEPKKGAYFIDREHVMWTQGETEDTRYWVPTYDYPNDKTTWEFYVRTPSGERALSNGRLVDSTAVGTGMEWHWSLEKPASTYLMSVVTGDYAIVRDHWNDVPVDYWTYPDSIEAARRGFGKTPEAIDLYSRKTGVPYPWSKYDQSAVPDYIFGGMENVTATTQADDGILHPAWAEPQANADGLVAHELGHQWYGDLLTTETWANVWLNEGFATFMEQIFTEEDKGSAEGALDRLNAQDQVIQADHAARRPLVYDRWVTDPLELFFSGHIYPKGATVLQMLRHQLGDSLFWAAMHRYTVDNAYQNVTTDDLERAFEQTTGRSFDRFFQQWVYGAGFPVFRVQAAYDSAAGAVRLTADQVQSRDSLTGFFDAGVDVAILTDRGTVRQIVPVRGEHTTASIPVSTAPRAIEWDEGGWLLDVTDFPRSTSMLAYQLVHAGDVAGRLEAADLLREREGEGVAEVLGAAARSDAFWGVRARAVDALADFTEQNAARDALLAATHDPDARVRQHAAGSLSGADDAAAEARLLALTQTDPSYYVRATALIAYARMAPAPAALDAVRSALGQDTWLDLSRLAATAALGNVEAPEAWDLLLRYIGPETSRRTRTQAIRSLTAKAQGREAEAARAIAPLLDDDDLFIRQAAAQALGRLGQASSLPALQARLNVEAESRVKNDILAAISAIQGEP
ncbi:MAG TPA: M1 family aminopeptidase [Rhodothermales bacterium]|nr:M1 family aminopeptidase [Rhodothermales bacterium]